MNILILSDIETSGEWIATQNMLTELKKRSNLNFFLLAYGKQTFHLQKELYKEIVLIDKAPLIPPFRYYRQIALEIIAGVKYLKQLKKVTKKIDLVIATDYSLSLSASLLFPFVKRLFWFHGIKEIYKTNLGNFKHYAFIKKILERLAWIVSRKIIVPSQWAKKFIESELGIFSFLKTVIIIPNIVSDYFLSEYSDLALVKFKKHLNIPKNKKIILYSGVFDRTKGLESLINAFILLRNKANSVVLVIAYPSVKLDKITFNKLSRIINASKVKASILLIKDLPRRDLAKLYQASNLAVLASQLEMNSLFLLESLSSGLPIFATPVGNAEALIKKINPFFILKDGSKQTIHEALNKFFKKDQSWHRLMRKKIKNFAKKELFNTSAIGQFEKQLEFFSD